MKATSLETRQLCLNFTQSHYHKIKEALRGGNLCAPEIQRNTGLDRVAVSRRTSELERNGEIVAAGTKKMYNPQTQKYARYTLYALRNIRDIEVTYTQVQP